MAGEERAESPVAEREKERECRTGVSQKAGRKRANCDAIGCMRCRAPFIGPHAAACAGAQLPMLLPATVEFYFAGEPAESLPLLLYCPALMSWFVIQVQAPSFASLNTEYRQGRRQEVVFFIVRGGQPYKFI